MSETIYTDRVLAAIRDLLPRRRAGHAERAAGDRGRARPPLRVAVTGRVNAGKSTLVNALLRRRIAPTDVTECTRYACWFQHGVPERVEVVGPDGTREPCSCAPTDACRWRSATSTTSTSLASTCSCRTRSSST